MIGHTLPQKDMQIALTKIIQTQTELDKGQNWTYHKHKLVQWQDRLHHQPDCHKIDKINNSALNWENCFDLHQQVPFIDILGSNVGHLTHHKMHKIAKVSQIRHNPLKGIPQGMSKYRLVRKFHWCIMGPLAPTKYL